MLIRRVSIPAVSMRYYSFIDGRTANLRGARIPWLPILQPPRTRKGSIIASCPCERNRRSSLLSFDFHRCSPLSTCRNIKRKRKRKKKRNKNGTRSHVRFHAIIFGFWYRVHVVRRFPASKLQQICLRVANIVCSEGNSFMTIGTIFVNVTFCLTRSLISST